jgi:DNA excision repair protein ERCC-2
VQHPYAVLIDEAHNLVERSREMYSATITETLIKQLDKATKKGSSKTFRGCVNKLVKTLQTLMADVQEPQLVKVESRLLNQLDKFLLEAQLEMRTKRMSLPDEAMDAYFKILRFFRLRELVGDHYRDWGSQENDGWQLTFYCLDPSRYLNAITKKIHSVVFFSATLAPLDYYLPMLGAEPHDARFILPSPFPRENFKVMVTSHVNTTLKKRANTYVEVALYLERLVEGKLGNYLIFFPSYQYLEAVKSHLHLGKDTVVIAQSKDMSLLDRQTFLNQFTIMPTNTTVGLAVLGGIFSEGIDLVGDRLIGVGIVSVGLPQLSFARDLIAEFQSAQGHHGFTFSYVYPAINKVLQAMGRVIRSETDRGVALLIDERFLREEYQAIGQRYPQYEVVLNPDEVDEALRDFFVKD